MFNENDIRIATEVADKLCTMESDTLFWSALGMAIDQWTATKGKTFEEAHEMLANLLEVHESVNKAMGPMEV